MQRHFSNRGEPRAEVTAAKMLAGREPSTQSQSIARIGRPRVNAKPLARSTSSRASCLRVRLGHRKVA
jgi:hypothetical protein